MKLNGKTLKAGTDYAVTYKNNKKVGKATVTVIGMGNYKDSAEAKFTIKLGKARLSIVAHTKAKTVDTSWKKVKGAKKYQLQWRERGAKWKTKIVKSTKATVRGMEPGKLYDFRIRAVSGKSKGVWSTQRHRWLQKQVGVKVTSGNAGAVKVSWSETAKANAGYLVVVRYSKSGEAVVKQTVSAGKKSVTVKGLTPGKRAWVQVRPLQKAGGTIYAGVFTRAKERVKVTDKTVKLRAAETQSIGRDKLVFAAW